jgi:signal peptidase
MKHLRTISFALYVLAGLTAAVFLLPQSGWRALSVQTGSMEPSIATGSLVLIHKTPYRELKVGQVVTYNSASKEHETVTHRVAALQQYHGLPIVITKGDANATADPWVPGGAVVGKVALTVPFAGTLFDWAKTPVGLILLVGLPGLLVIWSEFELMIRRLQQVAREELQRQRVRMAFNDLWVVPTIIKPRRSVPVVARAAISLLLVVFALSGGAAWAALSSSVSMTNNQIGLAVTNPNPNPTAGCQTTDSTISISNTGPGSNNQASVTSTCTQTSTDNTAVTVTNNSSQTSSGGAASNSNNTQTDVNVTNSP